MGGDGRGFTPIGRAELGEDEDIGDVIGCGLGRNEEPLGDLGVG